MKKRAILLLAAFAAAMVVAIAAVRWKDLAVRFQVFRLSGKPQLQDAWLERPADSIEGRAARTYLQEKPGEAIRAFLRALPSLCEEPNICRGLPDMKNFGAADRVRIALWPKGGVQTTDGDLSIVFYWEYGEEGGQAWIDSKMYDWKVSALHPLFEILKANAGKVQAIAEYPGWKFTTFFEEANVGLSAGIRGQHGDWIGAEDEIETFAQVWTGRELLLLGWPNGAALDPVSGKWRTIRGIPRRTAGWPPCALRWDDRRVLLSSNTAAGTAFDLYRLDQDSWETIGETSPDFFEQPGELGREAGFTTLGGTTLGPDALVFVQSSRPGSPVRGIRIDPSGRLAPISVLNAPRDSYNEAAIHSFGNKVFFWSYADVTRNSGAIWDGDEDRWEQLPQAGLGGEPRYSFSHFKAGDEVVILGGSRGFGRPVDLDDAIAFSMRDRAWRRVPVPSAARRKRKPAAGWTGKAAWVWEGDWGSWASEPWRYSKEKPEAATAGLLDLATGVWKPFPAGGPSPRHSPWSAWTGEEILFLGGRSNDGRTFYRDVWAFNPTTSVWRRLDNIPRSRQECARQ